jgi:hypothetical protein
MLSLVYEVVLSSFSSGNCFPLAGALTTPYHLHRKLRHVVMKEFLGANVYQRSCSRQMLT